MSSSPGCERASQEYAPNTPSSRVREQAHRVARPHDFPSTSTRPARLKLRDLLLGLFGISVTSFPASTRPSSPSQLGSKYRRYSQDFNHTVLSRGFRRAGRCVFGSSDSRPMWVKNKKGEVRDSRGGEPRSRSRANETRPGPSPIRERPSSPSAPTAVSAPAWR